MLGAHREQMELADFGAFLREKCAVRKVTFAGADDFFPAAVLAHVEQTWEQWLGPLVPGLRRSPR